MAPPIGVGPRSTSLRRGRPLRDISCRTRWRGRGAPERDKWCRRRRRRGKTLPAAMPFAEGNSRRCTLSLQGMPQENQRPVTQARTAHAHQHTIFLASSGRFGWSLVIKCYLKTSTTFSQFIRVAQLPRLSVARQSAVPSTAANRFPNGNQGMQSFKSRGCSFHFSLSLLKIAMEKTLYFHSFKKPKAQRCKHSLKVLRKLYYMTPTSSERAALNFCRSIFATEALFTQPYFKRKLI